MATSKPEMFAELIADYFGFSKYFELYRRSLHGIRARSKKNIIEYVIETCNISQEEQKYAVMVGDRSMISSAQRSADFTASVCSGYGAGKNWRQSGAERIADTEVPGEMILSSMVSAGIKTLRFYIRFYIYFLIKRHPCGQ